VECHFCKQPMCDRCEGRPFKMPTGATLWVCYSCTKCCVKALWRRDHRPQGGARWVEGDELVDEPF